MKSGQWSFLSRVFQSYVTQTQNTTNVTIAENNNELKFLGNCDNYSMIDDRR